MIISDLDHLEYISDTSIVGGFSHWKIRPLSLEDLLTVFNDFMPPWVSFNPETGSGIAIYAQDQVGENTLTESMTGFGTLTGTNGNFTFSVSSSTTGSSTVIGDQVLG
jgi:hypothetical protein